MNIDDDFRQLNNNEVLQLFHFHDRDVNVQAATQILIQSLLSGGIWIDHPVPEFNKEQQRQFDNLVWSKWCTDILRSLWSVGFAAAILKQDDQERIIPSVLPLETLDIRMRRHDLGDCEFKYFTRVTPLQHQPKEIPNVITFVQKEPDCNFRICSTVSTLLMDYSYEMHMMQCTITAEKSRSQPLLVTESVDSRYDPSTLTLPRWAEDAMLGDGNRPFQDQIQNESVMEKLQDETRYTWQRFLNSNQSSMDTRMKMFRGDGRPPPKDSGVKLPPEVPLKPQQKLTRHVLAEVPANLLPFRTERQTRTFMAFGVPMSMSSTQGSKSNTSSSKVGGNSSDSSSKDMFLNAQKSLKQFLLSYIQTMYRFMNHNRNLLALIKNNTKAEKKLSNENLKQQNYAKITIASLPDETVADRLYELGLLKYDALVRIYCQKYGMDERDFNEKAVLPMISIDQKLNKEKIDADKLKTKTESSFSKPAKRK